MGFGSNLLTPMMGIDISVGEHVQRQVFGLTINVDIVWATCIAGAIVILLGLILRAKATSGVPGKFQLLWEMAVGAVQTQVEDSIGPVVPRWCRSPSPSSSSSSPATSSR